MRASIGLLLLGALLFAVDAASAQAPRRPHVYDKYDASREAYALGEQRRQYRMGLQSQLNDDMMFWSRSFAGWAYWSSPWPFLPGDIYGYPLPTPPINQPIAQEQEQIDENTWVSRPVYADELDAEAMPRDTDEFGNAVPPQELPHPSSGPREF